MSEYIKNGYLCRVSRTVRVYSDPTDNNSESKILQIGTKFLSYLQYTNGSIQKFQISAQYEEEVPIGMWCVSNLLDMIPVELQSQDQEDTSTGEAISNSKEKNSVVSNAASKKITRTTILKAENDSSELKGKKGIDTTSKITKSVATTLSEKGVEFVGRYLSTGSNDQKAMTADEVKNITGAGLSIASIYKESGASSVTISPSGDLGKTHGTTAKESAQAIGVPTTSCIYFDVSGVAARKIDDLVDYIEEARRQCSPYPIGVVGSREIIDLLADRTESITSYWQTYQSSMSGHNISKNADIFQGDPSTNFVTSTGYMAGINFNYNGAKTEIYNNTMWDSGTGGTGEDIVEIPPPDNKITVSVNGDEYDVTYATEGDPDSTIDNHGSTDGVTQTNTGMLGVMEQVWSGITDMIKGKNYDPNLAYQYADEQYRSLPQEIESSLSGWTMKLINQVHGLPFQFTDVTDRRYPGDSYGRSFMKEIAANLPIVTIAPGKPKFMTNVTKGTTNNSAASTLLNAFVNDGGVDFTADVTDGDYDYYSIDVCPEKYFPYVNSLARASAKLMVDDDGEAVKNHKVAGLTKAEDFNWSNENHNVEQDWSMFEKITGQDRGVSFVFDPTGSVSDTISNSTTESQFSGLFNDWSSKAREIEFVVGYSGSSAYELVNSSDFVESATADFNGNGILGLDNVVKRFGSWLRNTQHGMNIRFPEIWSESSNQRSYDCEMHFIAPYATAFCVWRYVLVPFYHIFCLAAPKSNENSSQYSSPFIIRAFSRGYFNVELGIIESLTWKRFGERDMITSNGIPLQIDVSISFKDLYHTLAMTNAYSKDENHGSVFGNRAFFNNTGLMDMLGTLSGVNMNRINALENLEMKLENVFDSFENIWDNLMGKIAHKFSELGSWFYGV